MQNKLLSTSSYLQGLRSGDKMILGKAITLIESSLPSHREAASELLAACIPYSGESVRIGVTGIPGVGKSTFIEAFGNYLINTQDKKVGVLAIDPSSSRSGGSILGDKTRMAELSTNKFAYVRPSPSGGDLGGVRQTTSDTIILLETAGYNIIMIETVGVGQSETLVHQLVDFFLLLMLPGAGDSLQGIKRGIMEMADAIVINKADGDNLDSAKKAIVEYKLALSLVANTRTNWNTTMLHCSSTLGSGMDEVWNTVNEFMSHAKNDGSFSKNRKEQVSSHFRDEWLSVLKEEFEGQENFGTFYKHYNNLVRSGEMTSRNAAKKLIEKLKSGQ
jgi:LAO/AO transport system kinase